MIKAVGWKFTDPDIIEYEDEEDSRASFSFRLTRYKDEDTFEESLKIESLLDGAENGAIITSIAALDKDIQKLMRYGVVLSALEFRELRIVIEANYLKLQRTSINLNDDSRLADLLAQVKEFAETKKLVEKDLSYIPISQFNILFEECGYASYEMRALRKMLANKKYIVAQGDRFTVTHRFSTKPERAMAFFNVKLGVTPANDKVDEQ